MIEYVERQFINMIDDGGSSYDGVRFRRCIFDFCAISVNRDANKRTRARNIELIQCRTQRNSHTGPAVLENVMVDQLETRGLLILWDPLFRHVTLKGRIGEVKINPIVGTEVFQRPSMQIPFDRDKAEYYRVVDWALDISEGTFEDLTIEGVPSHLVRRNPKTQMVVKAEKAIQPGWRDKVIPGARSWVQAINLLVDEPRRPSEMVVAATAKGGRVSQEVLDGLQNLRDLGVAEPD